MVTPVKDRNEILGSIQTAKERFTQYNNAKISALNLSLETPEMVNFFNYIPFLFTVNLPEFPGYIKEIGTPHGIYNYQMPPKLLSQIRITNPSFNPPRTVASDPVIKFFALIGSAGTIAFTPDSDLDFWLCGDFSVMDDESVTLLRRKCGIIEKWAMDTHNKEIHFYLNDIDHIKRNLFDEDEEYGLSGTSLGQMLKEEFYRSSIALNGIIPFWWVTPPDCSDQDYSEWLSAVAGTALEKEFINLGNIAVLNRGDFLIAALFQIIKSLGNPFKSIIKLGLLERYIYDDKKNPFISNMIKKNIQDGRSDRLSVDAYCIMFDQVYEYYHRIVDDLSSLNIIKTCFYLKVNPHLSKGDKKAGNESFYETMSAYVKKWGWDGDTIKHVDNFENWDIESTTRMMNNTRKLILRGYKNILSALGNEINAGSIDSKSLQAINRKIYSHFKPENNKIDNSLNFKKYPPEKLLSLDYVRDVKGNESWYLSKRIISNDRAAKVLIQKSPHLISLIAWISLNGLYLKDYTRLEIEQGFYQMDANYIRDLIAELSAKFSIKGVKLQNSYFLRDPFPVMSYIIINPFLKYSKKIDEMYLLYHNSWGETRFESFKDVSNLPTLLTRIINGAIAAGVDEPDVLNVTSSAPYTSSREFINLKATIKSLLEFFIAGRSTIKQRYITMMANRYTIFSNTVSTEGNSSVSCSQYNSEYQMLYTISYNRGIINNNMTDHRIPELEYISEILKYDKGDSVNVFVNQGRKYSRIFVLNERGSLMLFRKKSEYHDQYLAGLISYIESTVKYSVEANPGSALAENGTPVKTFTLDIDNTGKGIISEFDYKKQPVLSQLRESMFQVSLSLHLLDSGEVGYRFTLPDGGYSEIFSRREIESVSREISSLIESFEGYSFYPTTVNLDYSEIRMYRMFTSFALSEKNRFELLIEKNLGMV